MKVIDLLNKIANGEMPKRIKKKDKIYVADDNNNYFSNMYIDENNNSHRLLLDFIPSLNDEVEIIEEDKNIEKLGYSELMVCPDLDSLKEHVNERYEEVRIKINKIIDILNKE